MNYANITPRRRLSPRDRLKDAVAVLIGVAIVAGLFIGGTWVLVETMRLVGAKI